MLTLKNKKRKTKESEKGMALVEAIPILFLLVVVFNFSLGFFGAIHSGILSSIGSYNYALETFRFKSNLVYFRPGVDKANYSASKNRVHGTTKEGSEFSAVSPEEKSNWPAAIRAITFNFVKGDANKGLTALNQVCDENGCRNYAPDETSNIWHAGSTYVPQSGQDPIQTPRIWIKTVYGICITADCGD